MNEAEFKRIVNYIDKKCGIDLRQKRVLIEGRLESHLMREGYRSYNEYMDFVEHDITGKEAENLVNIITTNHTYFMREPEHFEYFSKIVLPQLKKSESSTKDIHIWCGASSTGEEPYTLAMLMYDFFGFENREWDTKILATDISTNVLKTAISGIYHIDQIKALPETWKRRYFHFIEEDSYQVIQEIRNQVLFRQFNLMNQLPFQKKLHVVFLRNVMIYFDKSTKNQLVNRIYDVMEPGGYLFIGSTESIDRNFTQFNYIQPSVYRKPV